jgi:hypothetical protein
MPKTDALALSILDRTIERRKEQLGIARMTRNTRLEERLRREIRAMEADRRKLRRNGGSSRPARKRAGRAGSDRSVRAPSGPTPGGTPRATKSARRPTLQDESIVVPPHGPRWRALIAYIRHLNDSFPGEDLMGVVGLFSTERQFARHIRAIEGRLPARRRRGASTSRATPARKAGGRKKATSKKAGGRRKAASRKTRKATRSRSASGRRKASARKSAGRAKR